MWKLELEISNRTNNVPYRVKFPITFGISLTESKLSRRLLDAEAIWRSAFYAKVKRSNLSNKVTKKFPNTAILLKQGEDFVFLA